MSTKKPWEKTFPGKEERKGRKGTEEKERKGKERKCKRERKGKDRKEKEKKGKWAKKERKGNNPCLIIRSGGDGEGDFLFSILCLGGGGGFINQWTTLQRVVRKFEKMRLPRSSCTPESHLCSVWTPQPGKTCEAKTRKTKRNENPWTPTLTHENVLPFSPVWYVIGQVTCDFMLAMLQWIQITECLKKCLSLRFSTTFFTWTTCHLRRWRPWCPACRSAKEAQRLWDSSNH